jgi:hypothetical protein
VQEEREVQEEGVGRKSRLKGRSGGSGCGWKTRWRRFGCGLLERKDRRRLVVKMMNDAESASIVQTLHDEENKGNVPKAEVPPLGKCSLLNEADLEIPLALPFFPPMCFGRKSRCFG